MQLNANIESGHIIRQSMRYHHAVIRDWVYSAKRNVSASCLPRSAFQKRFGKVKKDCVLQALVDWVDKAYNPTAFLTIQLPDKLKTDNKERAQEHLRRVMAYFERQLLGREWNEYHLPFICFMEEGLSGLWHYHILFDQGKFKPWHLWLALDNTISQFGWPDYLMHLDIMGADRKKAISYCLKEIKVNAYGHFDSSRFVFSDELFKWGC